MPQQDPELDAIWIDAARRLGVEVVRGGDAYVHYDGKRLHIADDEHLDDDDRVAQLVFHELCHGITQGEARWQTPDWGLDNTKPDDQWREYACLRFQAHLAGGFGLRSIFFPTTPERPFYETLPPDPLDPVPAGPDGGPQPPPLGGPQSIALAQTAAALAHRLPFRPVLVEALSKSARHLRLPLHPRTQLPLATTSTATCGTCAWRVDNGFCMHVVSPSACRDDDPACVRHRPTLDCLRCGACCRAAYDAVYMDPREPVIKRHPDLVGVHGFVYNLKRNGDRCIALAGPPQGPYACTIYDDRPKTCRDFENGGRHCMDARRKIGLESMPPTE